MTRRELIEAISIASNTSIRAAAGVIQTHDIKFVMVCDEDRLLLGTITDGDIRRAVMDSIDLDGPAETIMNRHPKVANQHDNRWGIREKMRNSTIRHLPEVDNLGRVIDLFFLDGPEDVPVQENTVILMAGGKGQRLSPYTNNRPKPLLEVGGKPILERMIERLMGQGFHRFIISTNYLGDQIEEYFGDGSKLGVDIRFVREQESLGTAGSLSLLEDQDLPFLVVNGDIITKANFQALIARCIGDVKGVMGVREYLYTVPYGCLEVSGAQIHTVSEKPSFRHLINGGIYALAPDVTKHLPKEQYFDMTDLFQLIIDSGEITHYHQITEEWIDVGSLEDLHWARQLYDSGDNDD